MADAKFSSPSALDAVIVNYKTPRLTERCVRSILEYQITAASRIVVVDNCSGDGSARIIRSALPEIRLVEAGENAGFAAGVNQGVRALDGKYVVVLNPDTYFERNVRDDIIDAFENDAGIGVIGFDLLNPDGRRQYSARRFYSLMDIAARRSASFGRICSSRLARHLMKDQWHIGRPFDADWVLGAGFVIRRSVYLDLGGMDARYFLYFEDVDLCARVWRLGHRVVALPNTPLVHDHQRSSAARPLGFAGRAHLASLWRFTRKFELPIRRPPRIRHALDKAESVAHPNFRGHQRRQPELK